MVGTVPLALPPFLKDQAGWSGIKGPVPPPVGMVALT